MSNSQNFSQSNFQAALFAIGLDRAAPEPLHVQLAARLRALVLDGTAPPGMRLPASRQFAQELSVSRATTQAALEQLVAEGYLVARRGAGTFVAEHIPHLASPLMPERIETGVARPETIRPFQHNLPDLASFPYAQWANYLASAWRRPHPDLLKAPDPFGWGPLRQAIAAHLGAWRGITCGAGQIAITSGAREAFELIARLFPAGATIQFEDPCFPPARRSLEMAGLRCILSPVDEDGFDPARIEPDVAGVVVTPSRQYPLGMALPLPRRLELLEWAKQNNTLVIEDDYDSEFRFSGQPLPAMTSLDGGERTIYVGSFSKLLSPSLRLGYLVVPERHIDGLSAAIGPVGSMASLVPQPALASFLQDGTFATHLRRMRRIYARRRAVLTEGLQTYLDGWLVPRPEPSGLNVVCGFGPRLDAVPEGDVVAAADRVGLTLQPLSPYFETGPAMKGVLLGFAHFDEATLAEGVRLLGRAITALAPARRG
ncbi:aminotransferase class I/II-fold pyridoxal phosphate-dependent enzyme [Alphaproteobacteria bacterium GH1-50]|uniref:Aminotransferase class I/II-fold pyridoxal phosphate-dependent enzyme n=1 Tax=Kangsaoukella pontilimi TaxID=2691042 RepID=A0A7C9IG55_9RHOB|nr:PLP-dependent aminotransferase family protein [Kangsaoukella pontilimi]MXQ07849.1 aminotransferase class I/II-fold pyridoxal phosphate-dependent enzyme [Kangsaoukella pontilimi]